MNKHHPRYQAWLDKVALNMRNRIDEKVMMTTKLEELNRILLAMCGDPHLVTKWWNAQNRAFDYATPKEIYEETPEKVIAYVMEHYR